MKIIKSNQMPEANGHYSTCIEHNGILYISGQLPFEPTTRTLPVGIKMQTDQVLKNIESILSAAGSNKNKVIQVRLYLSDINNWDTVNQIYSLFFGDHKPVRCVVPVTTLHFGALIEVEVTAAQ
ncbi:MAG: RidA family protein [Bacteroidales bacterium]|nr:RidA family protein [Bacteroidales bacterium]MCF8456425.1 RidA family protein [Bacteroidales bacterium]